MSRRENRCSAHRARKTESGPPETATIPTRPFGVLMGFLPRTKNRYLIGSNIPIPLNIKSNYEKSKKQFLYRHGNSPYVRHARRGSRDLAGIRDRLRPRQQVIRRLRSLA